LHTAGEDAPSAVNSHATSLRRYRLRGFVTPALIDAAGCQAIVFRPLTLHISFQRFGRYFSSPASPPSPQPENNIARIVSFIRPPLLSAID